jgi:crotonobetaine/carnitine-CoA ligase
MSAGPGRGTTLNGAFRAAVAACPDRLYLDFSGDKYSYERLAHEVDRFARGLHALGVRRGDRVVSLMENGPDPLTAWYAVNQLGAVHVPINTAYKGEYLRHQINDSGARVVICENAYAGNITEIGGSLAALEHIVHREPGADRGDWTRGFSAFEEHRLDTGDTPFVEVGPNDLAAIIYTSGTTGMSKGCMASHQYFCDLPWRYAESSGRTSEDFQWSPMPLFHVGGVCVVSSTMQLQSSASLYRKFSASKFWHEIERSGANHVMMIGSMAQMIANGADTPESKKCHGQIRILLAAPMSPALGATMRERFGIKWTTGFTYGSTECGQALEARYDLDVPPGSCGRVNDAYDVKIFDEDGREAPTNTVGEFVCRPKRPNVMFQGYWNNPGATIAAWKDLWHHMGDQGRVDEHGNFFFVDRSKDVIRRRGENISSFELEAIVVQHPNISEVAFHAVPSDLLEDDVKATIVREAGSKLTESELFVWCQARVPKFAMPRYIEFRDELPKNASNRVLKFQLREQGVTPATWDSQK